MKESAFICPNCKKELLINVDEPDLEDGFFVDCPYCNKEVDINEWDLEEQYQKSKGKNWIHKKIQKSSKIIPLSTCIEKWGDFDGRLIWEGLLKKEKLNKQRIKEQKIEERLKKEKQAEEFAKSQRKKGLELFESKWVDKKELPKLKEIQIGLDKNFQNLSPYDFEKFIAKLFEAMGYETRVTQASNDYGIDVVAKKENENIAIQCKRYAPGNPIGNRDVQRLLGAMQLKDIKANHSIIITTSHFTVQAREQANECAIELWDRHDLEKMVRKYLMKI